MGTITGLTAARMLAIEGASVVDGDVVAGNLILTKHNGSTINAGSVIGPEGPPGPAGSDLAVLAAQQVYDVGVANQIRAGRVLTAADFGNIGLSAPIGLWNFSNSLSDVSGNGRTLTNKGSVPFDIGILGVTNTCVIFDGTTAKALYRADTGSSDPFRIKSGSYGCWFRTAKRGANQTLISKWKTGGLNSYILEINSSNVIQALVSSDGTDNSSVIGITDVADDRWHFVVTTFDGSSNCIYVDGVLEDLELFEANIFSAAAPFNVGGASADASTVNAQPHYGLIDEAFITSDVLTLDQVYNLYCAKIPHSLGSIPSKATVNIRRSRKGPALVTGDFLTAPLRLYNFSSGALTNAGSTGFSANLTNVNSAVKVAGADGTTDNAFDFIGASSQYLKCTDTGMPSGLDTVSYGCWIKTLDVSANPYIMSWGTTIGTNDVRLDLDAGDISAGNGSDNISGPFIADGKWHFIVVVHENTALDGIKRKLYVDGELVGISLVMNSVTLAGADKFVIGGSNAPGSYFSGQLDTVFVSDVVIKPYTIAKIYAKVAQELALSPKNAGDHIQAMSSADLLASFDTLPSNYKVDLNVS